MTIKFSQLNMYITQELVGQEIAAHLIHDPILGTQFGFCPMGVWMYVSRVDQIPFFVKGTEEEIENLKRIGFGASQGLWGVYS